MSYNQMNDAAGRVPPGSENLLILPYGNGAERTLTNKNIHASMHGLDFSVHTQAHLFRASQEGIVFALRYGLDVMRSMGVEIKVIRAGYANMFQSKIFAETFATVCNTRLELYNTDGAQGAARGAGIGSGIYSTIDEAFYGLTKVQQFEPDVRNSAIYEEVYARWAGIVHDQITR
jgi:xylulokinase